MSQPCGTCLGGPDCIPSDDLNLMSLDSQLFPFVPNCPPGFDCFGTLIGGGTLSFPYCGNQVLTRTFPAGLTVAQILQIISQMLAQIAQLIQFCPGTGTNPTPSNPTQIYFNNPKKCTSFCPDGSPFTYYVGPGRVAGLTQAAADSFAYTLACALATLDKVCLSPLATTVFCGDTPLTIPIQATGGGLASYPFTNFWQASGALPTGLTFNGGNAGSIVTITGTATVGGSFTFIVSISTPTGVQSKSYTIRVLHIDTASPLPAAAVGSPYSQTLSQTGGLNPVTWQLATGSSLPTGLSLNSSTGVISGTPTGSGASTFTVTCRDSSISCQKQFSLTVNQIILTSSQNPAYDGATVNLTATFPASANGDLAYFFDGVTQIDTQLIVATVATSVFSNPSLGVNPTVGTHVLTAIDHFKPALGTSNPVSQVMSACPNPLNVGNYAAIFSDPCGGPYDQSPGRNVWDGTLVPTGSPKCGQWSGIVSEVYVFPSPIRFPGTQSYVGPLNDLALAGGLNRTSANSWQLIIESERLGVEALIWSGTRDSTGDPNNPRGVYTRTGGCNLTATITIS